MESSFVLAIVIGWVTLSVPCSLVIASMLRGQRKQQEWIPVPVHARVDTAA